MVDAVQLADAVLCVYVYSKLKPPALPHTVWLHLIVHDSTLTSTSNPASRESATTPSCTSHHHTHLHTTCPFSVSFLGALHRCIALALVFPSSH